MVRVGGVIGCDRGYVMSDLKSFCELVLGVLVGYMSV